jgi:hypothetical protein
VDAADGTRALTGTVTSMANGTVRSDLKQARSTRVDVSRLVGTWFGIKLDENRIAKLVITEEESGLLIHPYGSPDSDMPDWGQAEAVPHVDSGSTTATGFQAHCRVGAMRVEFVVVENQGVLLVQTFTSFPDESGRTSEFGKAYYRRSAAELVATTGISTGTISGEWVNSNPVTNWVAGFTVTEGAGATTISIRGASDPVDWGEVKLAAYADRHGESNFYAEYDLEPFKATIGVISVKNLVVLNQFRRFKDGESIPSFCREFFFRNR